MLIINIIIGQLHFPLAGYKNYQGSLTGRAFNVSGFKFEVTL